MWAAAGPAAAHPLGNFTVNRYDGLTLRPDRVEDLAVVDTAEIPTLQAKPAMDTDHDGVLSTAEAAGEARKACSALTAGIHAATSPAPADSARPEVLTFRLQTSSYHLVHGQAGLDTGRLECRLTAEAALGRGTRVQFASGVDDSRIGWHEITARGDGIPIGTSDVPTRSVSRELHAYPADLLTSPLDTRHAAVVLGAGSGAAAAASTPGAGWAADWYTELDRHLGALTDRGTLTLPVGMLAILMSLVLGAGHAALPGHGKTIMAAYLAGRQGRPRDAVTVAGTVTLTHTASVLALGVALSVSSALVGEDVLAWLGTASGLVITAAGLWLLPAALTTLRDPKPATPRHRGHDHHHSPAPHTHDHAQMDKGAATASAGPDAAAQSSATAVLDHPPTADHDPDPDLEHDHGHTHGGHDDHHHGHEHGNRPHTHDWLGRHRNGHAPRPHRGGGGLVGIGIAGGLVPSPSALVVLLGSIALGRTAFGVLLVICYGLGMAATLAAAGLLLLRLRDKVPTFEGSRWHALAGWGTRLIPLGTATLILAVGIGTALRAVPV
ncbi:ABC-type nickel/cobalt efflux system, permease component RcnA [Actinacidiphila paucisporea]|uniref:ABC-type nickel/cobalt efflux system, permease component RcnA n=2 Tax=Actinacidiphila paucisporea TaxID=310782 RepID=A0A1M7NNB2_9ACTN|nr:ABC-type nickel/cobalt efflux system, permease component RcnA [Actinacidiphila paucisporea]